MKSEFQICVPATVDKGRLDVFICEYMEKEYPGRFSRSEIQHAISEGACLVNEKSVRKSGYSLKGGELLKITIQTPVTDLSPDPTVRFDIIYEDEAVLLVNKPAGLVVHPAPGVKGSTLVHGILSHIKGDALDESPERPGIVHRLDKDTSGIMVVAKTAQAKRHLQAQLKEPRTMKRVYHAICLGVPKKKRGVQTGFDDDRSQMIGSISASIARHPHKRIRYIVSDSPDARHALSHFRVLDVKDSLSLIEFTLETGRTHQIRVHSEYAGCPIMGDAVYGPTRSAIDKSNRFLNYSRQMLHARSLSFVHPVSEKLVDFMAAYPDEFRILI